MLSDNGSCVIFALLLMLLRADSTSTECMQSTPCSCILSSGLRYDITNLSNSKVLTATGSNYTFYFQPCKNVRLPENDLSSECSKGDGVSLCARNDMSNKTFVLGTVEETVMEYWPSKNKNPTLMVHHGNVTTMITLLCCNPCTTQLTVDSVGSDAQYHLLLASPYACKVAPHIKGLSTGSILVILFLVFSGLYFIGGAIALKFLRGATGWEMLPNHEFWCELPSLVRDGIVFTFNCFRGDSYERI